MVKQLKNDTVEVVEDFSQAPRLCRSKEPNADHIDELTAEKETLWMGKWSPNLEVDEVDLPCSLENQLLFQRVGAFLDPARQYVDTAMTESQPEPKEVDENASQQDKKKVRRT